MGVKPAVLAAQNETQQITGGLSECLKFGAIDLLETGPGAIITALAVGLVLLPKAAEAKVMRRVINEAGIWPPNSVGRRGRRTTRIERLLRLLERALPSRDPWDWEALADAASREIAAQPPKWGWRP